MKKIKEILVGIFFELLILNDTIKESIEYRNKVRNAQRNKQ